MCHAGSEDGDDSLLDSEDELADSSSGHGIEDDLDGIEAEYAPPRGWPCCCLQVLPTPDIV